MHFQIAGSTRDYKDDGDESDERDAIPATSQQQQATSQLASFDLGLSYIDQYEWKNGNDADEEEVEEASLADNG